MYPHFSSSLLLQHFLGVLGSNYSFSRSFSMFWDFWGHYSILTLHFRGFSIPPHPFSQFSALFLFLFPPSSISGLFPNIFKPPHSFLDFLCVLGDFFLWGPFCENLEKFYSLLCHHYPPYIHTFISNLLTIQSDSFHFSY